MKYKSKSHILKKAELNNVEHDNEILMGSLLKTSNHHSGSLLLFFK